MSQRKSR